MTDPGEETISLLLSYHLDDIFRDIFREIGFKVLWATTREEMEKIVAETEPDLALEWHHGPRDFPLGSLLRSYGRETPVISSLNWRRLMSIPKNVNCAGAVRMPYKVEELMRVFGEVLPIEKRSVLRELCEKAGIKVV